MHPIFAIAGGDPIAEDLFTRALRNPDYMGDVVPGADLQYLAANVTDAAIGDYEYDRGIAAGTLVVSASVIDTVRRMLVAYANDALLDAADASNDLFRDAREAGDVDANGDPVHETYRSIGQ